MYNLVILIGVIGTDPEVKYTQSGNAVARMRVGIQEQENTSWFTVKAFGKTAEICGNHARKGMKMYIIGRLHQYKWMDRNMTEVIANRVFVLKGFDSELALLDQPVEPTEGSDDDVPF